jgi:meso-butanediol dehydrogenase/(S,S)-butanediol dehydrogenase/diacetyl reductase
VALVTGGSNGIGAAIVARLAGEGANVLIADRTPPAATCDAIRYIATDVASADEVAAAVAAALGQWGQLDLLFNNAGVGAFGATPDTDDETWDQVFAVNIRAIFLFCRAAIPAMRDGGGGAIVNIASISGLAGDYGMGGLQCLQGRGGELYAQLGAGMRRAWHQG